MEPGDTWDSATREATPRREKTVWEDGFYDAQARAATTEVLPWEDGSVTECDALLRSHFGEQAPWNRWRRLLKRGNVELTVHGDDGKRVYCVDTHAGTFSQRENPAAELRMEASAFMLCRVLDGAYDAYMALYSQRATQRIRGAPWANARLESDTYENVFQVLFGSGHG